MAALVAASRAFAVAGNAIVGDARAMTWLRAMLRQESDAALMLLAVRPLREKVDLLPELVACLDARLTTALLAADVIRAMPRRELAVRLPFAVEAAVGDLSYEGFDQLTSLLVELRDKPSLDVALAAAAAHDDPDTRELAADLEGVHLDPTRWGLTRAERQGGDGGGPGTVRYTVRLVVRPGDRVVEHAVVTRFGELKAAVLAALRQSRDDPGSRVRAVEVVGVEPDATVDPARDLLDDAERS